MISRTQLVCAAILILLLMVDVMAVSWMNFHTESRKEVLWSYGYYSQRFYLNGKIYDGIVPFPIAIDGFGFAHIARNVSADLKVLGTNMVFYFRTLDSKYQNVTYYYSYQTRDLLGVPGSKPDTILEEFSLSIVWTYDRSVCDVAKLLFVIFLSMLILVFLLFIPFTKKEAASNESD